ncbi:MAG: UDP-N-acetylglucosamine 1-carboxyvinyltransferase [bacterium]|nr:UDP-N-acetylglucosamine 1-carboxyvinyltransferase [bacterium]
MRILVTGGRRLEGQVKISGAKNAALPILAATILSNDSITLRNIPVLRDVDTMLSVLNTLGIKVKKERNGEIYIDPSNLKYFEAPYELVKSMRASILVMGALLSKLKKARVALPGGCAIGPRPIDLHLEGLKRFGAKIDLEKGYIEAETHGLKGCYIHLEYPSVGATENLMMAATLAEGETIIDGAAKEPEIVDLACFLNKMGARISGHGTDRIRIEGVKELRGTIYKIIPDRIEAGTYVIAAAITKGDVTVSEMNPSHLWAVTTKLREAGVWIEEGESEVRARVLEKLRPVDVKTLPYPGFPTDMQAQFMALMAITPGRSIITETVFKNRFMHVDELNRMGAVIKKDGNFALIDGVESLSGAEVCATDLRASACLILAGLAAKGDTFVSGICHLDRGYERMEKKLAQIGAKIERIE